MSYSIAIEMHPYADRKGLHKVRLLVIYQRMKARYTLPFKLKADQLHNQQIVNHPNKLKLTTWLKKDWNEMEGRLIDFLKHNPHPTVKELREIVSNKTTIEAISIKTLQDLLDIMITEGGNSLSPGRIKHYRAFKNLISEFRPMWSFSRFTTNEVALFHQHLIQQNYTQSTIWSKFNLLKTVRTQAINRRLLNQDPFKLYRSPKNMRKIPVYTNETEMAQIKKTIEHIDNETYKQVGYYYLLGCYASYRISDLVRFNAAEHIIDNNRLLLRAKKNKEIVSIKIHNRLKEVLEYCSVQRLELKEQTCNVIIRKIATLANINKHLTMHSARHSFAMMMAENGAREEDVMELMGITDREVIKVYFRISNLRLDKAVSEALG